MSDSKVEARMPLANRIGFGAGGMVGAILGDFMYAYFLFFLTVGVGINPVQAGTVIMVATIWQAILNLIIGSKSDKKRYDKNGNFVGKKRPFLLRTAIPTGAFFALLYTVVDLGAVMTTVYYLGIVFLYYIAYVSYEIPYYAMAGSLTDNGDERTGIRRVATTIEYIGSFIMGVLPPFLIDSFVYVDDPSPLAWTAIGVILGGISIILILICCSATKGKEMDLGEDEEKFDFGEVLSILKIKPYLLIIFAIIMYFGYYTMAGNSFYFLLVYSGYEVFAISAIYGIGAILGMIFVNIHGKLSEKYDKKIILVIALLISGAVTFIFSFVGLDTFPKLLVYQLSDAFQGGAYWTILYLLIYDVADLDEFKGGKRREGTLVGFYSFIAMIATGIASQITGILLDAAEFDEEAWDQSAETMQGILEITTRWPGLCIIATGLILCLFPITRKKAAALAESLELKRNNEEYSTEGFEDLLK